ncbi:MAG: hypothetical protein ACFB9N_12000 [Geitlerinemataceae cyanobacterium]
MSERLHFAPILALALLSGLVLDRPPALAQTSPNSVDASGYASMSARDLHLDRLNYVAEPEPMPSDEVMPMQSRRQVPEAVELEPVTIELNDPTLSTHEQRSSFSIGSPLD